MEQYFIKTTDDEIYVIFSDGEKIVDMINLSEE